MNVSALLRYAVAAGPLLLLTFLSAHDQSRGPICVHGSRLSYLRRAQGRQGSYGSRYSGRSSTSSEVAQLLRHEPWRHDTQFQVVSGKVPTGLEYYSKFTVNRPLWGIFKMFEAQGLEAKMTANPTLTVLELGCGEGRALLELQARFPRARVICVNLPAYGQQTNKVGGATLSGLNKDGTLETMTAVAKYYNISWQPDTHNTPEVVYADVTEGDLPMASGFVDLIFSRAVVSKFTIDSKFLAGAMHTLAPTGEAFIHTDSLYKQDCPALNLPGAPSLVLLCKRLEKYGKCMKLVSQYADTRRVAGGKLFEVSRYYVMALIGDCSTYGDCDAGSTPAGTKLSRACRKKISAKTSMKLSDLQYWSV